MKTDTPLHASVGMSTRCVLGYLAVVEVNMTEQHTLRCPQPLIGYLKDVRGHTTLE